MRVPAPAMPASAAAASTMTMTIVPTIQYSRSQRMRGTGVPSTSSAVPWASSCRARMPTWMAQQAASTPTMP